MEFFRILWRMLPAFRKEFAAFLLIVTVYEAVQIVDSYIFSFAIGLLSREVDTEFFILFFFAILVFDEVFIRLDNIVDWRIISRLLYPVYRHFKGGVLDKFLQMDMRWHHQQRSGTLMGKAQDGTSKVQAMVEAMCWEFAPTTIQFVLSLIPLFWFSPPAALIVSGSFALFWLVTLKQHKAQAPLRKVRHDSYEEEWGKAQEMISNVEAVVLYNQTSRLRGDYESILHAIEESGVKEAQIGIFRYGRWRIRITYVARRALLALLVWQAAQGILTIASLVFVWTLSERLFHAFWRFARLYDRANQSLEAAKRIEGVFNLTPSIIDPVTPKSVAPGPVDIAFNNVTFTYDDNEEGVRNLTFTIRAGETVGIVGPSGAGKTTLRRLVTRAWDVGSGAILVNGVDVRELPLAQLRELFAYVPQGDEVAIFNETFAFNIAFGRPIATFDEVERASSIAGIHDFIAGCKDRYETVLGERGLRLSGGQKQRVALARAILANRPVLILDEATSSVDSITEDEIQERLLPILKDGHRTVIVIAHRLSTIWNVADRILVFNEGELVEQGTHEELLAYKGLYAELCARQTRIIRGGTLDGLDN